MKKSKKIKNFRSEDRERDFWASHDFTDYLESFEPVKLDVSKLKPSTKSITIRMPESLLVTIKTLANKRDVPYQSLMKVLLSEKVREEINRL